MDDIQWSVVSQIFESDNKHFLGTGVMDQMNFATNCSSNSAAHVGMVTLSSASVGMQLNNGGVVSKGPLTALEYAMSAGGLTQSQRRTMSRGRTTAATRSTRPTAATLPSAVTPAATIQDNSNQVIYSDKMPDSIGPGETLYAVVDGVAYEIVGGVPGAAGQLMLPSGDGTSAVSLVDYSNLTAGISNQAAVLGVDGNSAVGNTDCGSSPLAMNPSSFVCSDYSQLAANDGGSVATSSTDGTQIIVLPSGESYRIPAGLSTDATLQNIQQLVLQPGQPLPAELRQLMGGQDLPDDLSGYQFVIGDVSSVGLGLGSTNGGEFGAGLGCLTSGLGAVTSQAASDSNILMMLGDTSSVAVQQPVSFTRTVLAEECDDDDEFKFVTPLSSSSTDCLPPSDPETVPDMAQLPAPLTGYLNSYLGFVRGDKVETLSGVANSAIVRRPPMPRYVPELTRRSSVGPTASSGSDLQPTSPPVMVSLVYSGDAMSGGGDTRLVVIPSSKATPTLSSAVPTAVVSFEKVDGQSMRKATRPSLSKKGDNSAAAAVPSGEQFKSSRIVKRRKRSEDESDDEETMSNSEFSGNDADSDADDDPMWKPSMDMDKRHNIAVELPQVRRPVITTVKSRLPRTKATRVAKTATASRLKGSSSAAAAAAVSISTTPTGYVLQVGTDSATYYQDVIPLNPNDPHQYQKGDFVIERKDLHKTDAFPIWKIEVGRLLQKFDPELQSNGSLVHKSASIYSSWSGNIRTTFKAIETQVVVGTGRKHEVVRILPNYLPQPVDEGLELDPLMDLFNVYVQCLLSQALDPSFLSVLRQQKEEYYDGPLRQIDSLLDTARMAVTDLIQWCDSFQTAADTLPYYSLIDIPPPNSPNCQATVSGEKAVKLIHLYGPLYSSDDLTSTGRQVHQADAKGIPACQSAVDHFVTYHTLKHYKYLLYKKCIEEVVYARQDKTKSDADILAGCLQNRVFIQQLFRELKAVVHKFIVISVVDASEMSTQVSVESVEPPGETPATESIAEPVEPSDEPVELSTEPMDPSGEPVVQPLTEPVEPSGEPVELSTEPVERLIEPPEVPMCEAMEPKTLIVEEDVSRLILASAGQQPLLESAAAMLAQTEQLFD